MDRMRKQPQDRQVCAKLWDGELHAICALNRISFRQLIALLVKPVYLLGYQTMW